MNRQQSGVIRTAAASGKKVGAYPYAGIGDRVRITSGALAGVEGIVIGYKNQRHLMMSVDQIQSSISVEVDDCSMELVFKEERTDHVWSISSDHPEQNPGQEYSNALSS